MKPITWVGILLIVLGVLVFVYQGINYTHKKTILDVGSVRIATETQERFPLSPILGGLAVAGGVILVVAGTRKKS
jgi:drug/metabolite transporter (DMT)-like permease